MPKRVDEETGEVIAVWDLTDEQINAYIAEFEERWPGLLARLAEM